MLCIISLVPGLGGYFFSCPVGVTKRGGKENFPAENEAVVIVSNHESAADIFSIATLPLQYRWLSKDSVFKIPGIGFSMRAAGYISIQRGNQASHIRALAESARVIQSGVSMLFFPEGTRSETGELRPFKIGAFKLATEQKVKILPIALKGTRDLVIKNSTLPGSAKVQIRVLPKVDILPGEKLEEYAARVRGLIIEGLRGSNQ